MQIEQDYYKVLGIAPNASAVEIKDAYHKLAFLYHPDKNLMNPETTRKMMEINLAYTALSDHLQRSEHHNPMEFSTTVPQFKTGSKVIVKSRSSPYINRTGVVDKEPVKDTFHIWYMVKFESNGLSANGRFAEEQLGEVGE